MGFDDPRNQGLLALAAGLMAPSRGGSFGGAALQGLQGYQQAYGNASQIQGQQEQLKLMRDKYAFEMEGAQAERKKRGEFEKQVRIAAGLDMPEQQQFQTPAPNADALSGMPAQMGAQPVRAPNIGLGPLNGQPNDPLSALRDRAWKEAFVMNPQAAGQVKAGLSPKERELVSAGDGKFFYKDDPTRLAADFSSEKLTPLQQQLKALNIPLESEEAQAILRMGLQKSISHPQPTSITNNVGDKSLGQQIGPMMKAANEQLSGATNLARSADRMLGAINSGGVIAGPTADVRLRLAQVGQVLGIGGKDTEDTILRTRRVIRELADASVEARKLLAGQGQVTENEAKAVEKARSGQIDDLTIPEIRAIAELNIKHAHFLQQGYQQKFNALPKDLRPFYEVPGADALPAIPAPLGDINESAVDKALRKYGR